MKFIWLALITFPLFAFADCEIALLGLHKVQAAAFELNPFTGGSATTPQDLYLLLKNDEQGVRRDGLTPQLVQHLLRYEIQLYRLEGREAGQLVQFYKNALRRLLVQAARLTKRELATQAAGRPLDGEKLRIAERLLSSYIRPFNLEDEEMTLETAQTTFHDKPWLVFPWADAMQMADEWLRLPATQRNSIRFADNWVGNSPVAQRWTWNASQRFARILLPSPEGGKCCHSRPGCFTCPANRGFLRNP